MTEVGVRKLLESAGYTDSASKCAMAAIGRRFIAFSGLPKELDEVVVFDGKPLEVTCCGAVLRPTLRELLKQGDDGNDYEEGGEGASLKCSECQSGVYVINLCGGAPAGNCGKGYNHCTVCKGFGRCLFDYREAHCFECGKHYYAGGFSGCPCEEGDDDADPRNNCTVM